MINCKKPTFLVVILSRAVQQIQLSHRDSITVKYVVDRFDICLTSTFTDHSHGHNVGYSPLTHLM